MIIVGYSLGGNKEAIYCIGTESEWSEWEERTYTTTRDTLNKASSVKFQSELDMSP